MNESIVVFTSFALASATVGASITGACIGWLIRQYYSARQQAQLQSEINIRTGIVDAQKFRLHTTIEKLKQNTRKEKKKDRIITDLLLKRSAQRTEASEQESKILAVNEDRIRVRKQLLNYHTKLNLTNVRLTTLLRENEELKKKLIHASHLDVSIKPITVSDLKRGTNITEPTTFSIPSSETQTPNHGTKNVLDSGATDLAEAMTNGSTKIGLGRERSQEKEPSGKKTDIRSNSRLPKGAKISVQQKHSSGDHSKRANSSRITRSSTANAKSGKDDLKKIKGIGPAIEDALNGIGIRSFEHLAKLKKKDIKEVDQRLKQFSGRITRDNWVASARKLKRKVSTA